MPDLRRAKCKGCGARRDDGEQLSWTGLCQRCGKARLADNIDGLHEHRGPAFLRWRRGMAASVGAVLLDELEQPTMEVSRVA
jgi:hypothetical protein